jgi:hypothetical protein
MAEEDITDLYGFRIEATVQQQAVRLQCDGTSQRLEGAWAGAVSQLPPEAKLKGLVREVTGVMMGDNG